MCLWTCFVDAKLGASLVVVSATKQISSVPTCANAVAAQIEIRMMEMKIVMQKSQMIELEGEYWSGIVTRVVIHVRLG